MTNNKSAAIEATLTTESVAPPTLNVFGTKAENAVYVPNLPLSVRNNCQSGRWTIGDEEYGSKLAMTVVKFSKFFGSLGQTHHTLWGQLWFVAEAGELPQDVVMCTYLKGRSLSDFNRIVTEVMAKGVEPATGVFVPDFVKRSGQKPDETGVLKPINYYSLEWKWYERGQKFPGVSDPLLKQLDAESQKSINRLHEVAIAMDSEENQSYLLDLDGTKLMKCVDGLPSHEMVKMMAQVASTTPALAPAQ